MKCPFRTRTVEETDISIKVTSVEFNECLGSECPYFGKTVLERSPSGGIRSVTQPVCRRVEMEEHKCK